MSQDDIQQALGSYVKATSDNDKTGASLLAAKLAEDHYEEVFRYCARHLPTAEDAQDAAQEVFLRLVRSRALYEKKGKPLAYLYTCARNVCSDFYRKASPVGFRSDVEWESISDPRAQDDATRMSIADAIAHLPQEEQEMIELRYGQGLSVSDIAEIQQVSRFTVYRKCKHALNSLERALGGE